jgi:hypothetical protein
MKTKAIIIAACLFPLSACGEDSKETLAKACLETLANAKSNTAGRVPKGLVEARVKICGCFTEKISADSAFTDEHKKKITEAFVAQAKNDKATLRDLDKKLRTALPKKPGDALRSLMRGCAKASMTPPK